MKLRVKQGSVKLDDQVYTEGQTFEIDEIQGKSLLNARVVEEVVEEEPVKKPKKVKEEKPKEEKVEEAPVEEVVAAEPSLDWTRNELDEHAKGLGIEDVEKLPSKAAVLEAIQAKEVKTE